MKAAFYRFFNVIKVDFLIQLRTTKFWLLMAAASIGVWFCFPAADAGYMVLAMDGYRGAYSSAWIGMIMSMTFIWIFLIGFYVIRGSLYRDMETRVWQLLVATPLSRWGYIAAKWLGQILVLGSILLPICVVGVFAQWVRAESEQIMIWELLKPLLLLGLPCIAFMSMVAIVFDLIPWLRKTLGNVLYFFIWLITLVTTQQAIQSGGDYTSKSMVLGDPIGVVAFDTSYRKKLSEFDNFNTKSHFCMVCGTESQQDTLVQWEQWNPETKFLSGRLAWFVLAFLIVSIGAFFIDKSAANVSSSKKSNKGFQLKWLSFLLKPLQTSPFPALVYAEILMSLRSRQLWWWAAFILSWVIQIAGEPSTKAMAMVGSWLLFIDLYSRAGLKDDELNIRLLILSAINAESRVTFARWISLVFLGCLACLPALLALASSHLLMFLGGLMACLSLPTIGYALAKLSRSSRVFELCLCFCAYLALEQKYFLNVSVAPQNTIVFHSSLIVLGAVYLLWLDKAFKKSF